MVIYILFAYFILFFCSDEEREILSDPEEVMPPVAKFQSLCQVQIRFYPKSVCNY